MLYEKPIELRYILFSSFYNCHVSERFNKFDWFFDTSFLARKEVVIQKELYLKPPHYNRHSSFWITRQWLALQLLMFLIQLMLAIAEPISQLSNFLSNKLNHSCEIGCGIIAYINIHHFCNNELILCFNWYFNVCYDP